MGLAFHVMLIHLWRKWWTWNICLVHTECQHKNGVRGSSAPETKQLITRMVFHILQNSDSLHTEVTIVVQLCVLTELLNTGSIINRNVLPCDSGGTDPHNPGATSWASSHCGRAQGSDLADSITVTTHVDPCMRQFCQTRNASGSHIPAMLLRFPTQHLGRHTPTREVVYLIPMLSVLLWDYDKVGPSTEPDFHTSLSHPYSPVFYGPSWTCPLTLSGSTLCENLVDPTLHPLLHFFS